MVTESGSISSEESTLETKGQGERGDSDPKKCSLCDYEPESVEMGLLHMVSAHGGKFLAERKRNLMCFSQIGQYTKHGPK